MSSTIQRIATIVAVILIGLCAWYPPIQQLAEAQVDAGLKRALVSFASARTLNAVISVIQGTEFAVQPMGVGVTLTLGQVLDPINDLVEQLSSIMLLASVAFGVQKFLLAMGGHTLVSVLVTAAALAWAALAYRRKAPAWLARFVLVLLMIRFAIPVVTLGSEAVFQQLMAKDYQDQQASIELTSQELARSAPQVPTSGADQNWWQQLKDRVGASLPSFSANYESIRKSVEGVPERIVKLIVIFLAQTIIIPILLLWVLYRIVLGVVRPGATAGAVPAGRASDAGA